MVFDLLVSTYMFSNNKEQNQGWSTWKTTSALTFQSKLLHLQSWHRGFKSKLNL